MSCVMFHYDSERSGRGPGAPAGSVWHKKIDVNVGSAVRGAPLYVDNWTFAAGPLAGQTHTVVFAATTDNNVYAFTQEALSGGSTAPVWSQYLGPPVTRAGSNIPPPIGIASTPVLDREHRRMFVLSYQDDGSGNGIYLMYDLALDTGAVQRKTRLQDPGHAGRPTFDPNTVDQRGALNFVRGHIVAIFADFLAYDAGPYHGWVVSCKAGDLDDQAFFPVTRTVFGGGCWGPGGAVADSHGNLFVATGNATTADAAYWAGLPAHKHPGSLGDYFEGVLRLEMRDGLHRDHWKAADWYQPANAQWLNDNDLDFGSSSPIVLPEIDGTPLLVIPAKQATYLLNRRHLGHWGGELWFSSIFSGESHSAPAHYRTPAGEHYVYLSGAGTPGLACYRITHAGDFSLQHVWDTGLAFGDSPSSPTVGATESPNYALVWVADAGDGTDPVLRAFDALSGAQVFGSDAVASDALPAGPPYLHYPAITCAGNFVYVGNRQGFTCYGV
jgi:hypothetical protein